MDRVDGLQPRYEALKFNNSEFVPYGQTDIGIKRHNNEDSVLLFDPDFFRGMNSKGLHKVFAVADGVGGRDHGEVASSTTVKEIYKYASTGRYIRNEELQRIDMSIPKGATTLVLAQQLNSPNDYLIDSIGDSSPLLIDLKGGVVTELTRRDEDSQGRVTQVLGPEGSETASFNRSNQSVIRLREGQTLLLSTDGLTKYTDKGILKSGNLLATRKSFPNNEAFVRELIKMVNISGGSDNVSVVSIPFDPRFG